MKRFLVFLIVMAAACGVIGAVENLSSSSSSILSSSTPLAVELNASSTTVSMDSSTIVEIRPIRGIHLTASAAGSKKYRQNQLEKMLADTMINTVVIDMKEEEGQVYVPGVKAAERAKAFERAIPDLPDWLAELKKRGIYTVARIVVFKDNCMPRYNKSLGVHNPQGELWFDRHKITWLDPFNQDAWRYNILIALQAARLGFDEIQFDYIRFPTDGDLALMHFLKPRSRKTSPQALVSFLHEAAQVLHPLGVKISIDVFGLTTSVNTGMGIGQLLKPMAAEVDYVCPMTYPSHYAKGEYGIPNPNDEPYKTVHLAMRDALKALGPAGVTKLRPYLQDFSLPHRGIRYHAKEVRAQIQAAADMGILNWTLWNASCHYTLEALRTPVTPKSLAKATTAQAVQSVTSSTEIPSK